MPPPASSRWSLTGKSNDGGSPQRRISTASSSVNPSGVASSGGFGTRSRKSLRRPSAAANCCAELLDSWLDLPNGAIGLEQLAEDLGRSLPRQRGAEGVGIVAGGTEIDHLRESR